jgi:putative oxidoreductase
MFAKTGGGWEFPAFWTVMLLVQALLGGGAYAVKLEKFLGFGGTGRAARA